MSRRGDAGALGVLGDRAVVLPERLVEAPENEADVHVVGNDVLGRLEVVEDALVVAGLLERLGGAQDRRRRDAQVVGDPVQRRAGAASRGRARDGRDLLLQARVAEEKNEEEQSEPEDVQREEERRDEERGDRDAGRAARGGFPPPTP